jgi:hypothetical protein
MINSLKGKLILSLIVAIGFIYHSFSYIDFTGDDMFLFNRVLFYFIMILSVFNAGIWMQKYIQTKMTK